MIDFRSDEKLVSGVAIYCIYFKRAGIEEKIRKSYLQDLDINEPSRDLVEMVI